MAHPNTYCDLLEALHQEGCPVCRLSVEGIRRYFDSIAYECINDLDIRSMFCASHGFCWQHTRQWLEQPRLLGTAIIYQDVLAALTRELRALEYRRPGPWERLKSLLKRGKARGVLEAGEPCPACRLVEVEEKVALGCLLEHVDEWEFEEVYVASDGLCLPHLRAALAAAPDEITFEILVNAAVSMHESLGRQLDVVIRYFAPEYRYQPLGEERTAAGRAIRYTAGADRLGTPLEGKSPQHTGR